MVFNVSFKSMNSFHRRQSSTVSKCMKLTTLGNYLLIFLSVKLIVISLPIVLIRLFNNDVLISATKNSWPKKYLVSLAQVLCDQKLCKAFGTMTSFLNTG